MLVLLFHGQDQHYSQAFCVSAPASSFGTSIVTRVVPGSTTLHTDNVIGISVSAWLQALHSQRCNWLLAASASSKVLRARGWSNTRRDQFNRLPTRPLLSLELYILFPSKDSSSLHASDCKNRQTLLRSFLPRAHRQKIDALSRIRDVTMTILSSRHGWIAIVLRANRNSVKLYSNGIKITPFYRSLRAESNAFFLIRLSHTGRKLRAVIILVIYAWVHYSHACFLCTVGVYGKCRQWYLHVIGTIYSCYCISEAPSLNCSRMERERPC